MRSVRKIPIKSKYEYIHHDTYVPSIMKTAIQEGKKSKPTKSKFISHSHTLAGYAISRPAFETLAASLKPSTILPLLNQKGCLEASSEVFMGAMWGIGYEIPEPISMWLNNSSTRLIYPATASVARPLGPVARGRQG
jgi:hypothetical protein